jgi:hypothetical protein
VTFGGFTLALSARIKTVKGVLSIGLLLFLVSGSPIVIGPSLRQSAIGRFMDAINPFGAALNMLDSVVVDSQGILIQILPLSVLLCYAGAVLLFLHLAIRRMEL